MASHGYFRKFALSSSNEKPGFLKKPGFENDRLLHNQGRRR